MNIICLKIEELEDINGGSSETWLDIFRWIGNTGGYRDHQCVDPKYSKSRICQIGG